MLPFLFIWIASGERELSQMAIANIVFGGRLDSVARETIVRAINSASVLAGSMAKLIKGKNASKTNRYFISR